MSLHGNEFTQTVFRNYLSMVASKCTLDLRFSKNGECRTDGKVVVVPYETLDEEKRHQLTACILHEAGHARYSRFDLFGKMSRFEKEVLNTIEDCRIETMMCRLYAGAKGYFHRDFEDNRAKYLKQTKQGMKTASIFEKFELLTFYGANRYAFDGMYDVKEFYELAVAGIKACFKDNVGDQLVSEVELELRGVPNLKSTDDALAMTKRLIAILKNHFPNAKEPRSENDSNKEEEGENKEKGKDQTSSQGKGSDQKKGKSKQKGQGESKVSSRQNASGQSSQDEGQQANQDGPQGNAKSFDDALSEHEGSQKRTFGSSMDRKEAMGMKQGRTDKVASSRIVADTVVSNVGNHDCGRELCSEAKRESSKLTNALRSYIEAKADTDTDYVCAGSKVQTSRLHRVMTGSMKVFTRVSEDPESTNTACCILLDTSGSMGEGFHESRGKRYQGQSNMVKATKATLALYMALQNLTGTENVSTSVIAFPGACMSRQDEKRLNPSAVYLVDHSERMTSDVVARFGALEGYGPTPIIRALDAAAYDLSQVPNVTRRVCFVITDGSFMAPSETIDEARKLGIEFYGFSLDCEASQMRDLLGEKNVEEVSGDSIGPALIRMAKRIFM